MASFMNDLAKPYVEKLINGAIAESSYICCFTCIAKDFEEEKTRLEKERSTVKQRVDVATSRGEVVQANALSWEEEADNLIQEDTKTKQRCLFGFCPHIIWRYKRGKELTNKKEQMKRLIETGKQLSIGLPARLPDVERYSSQHYIPFKSRESKYKELLDALKDDNNYVIGLKGMGGTGKTTLAKEVGKELKQSNQFTQIIDTTVSFSPDIKKIQDDIAGPLGLKFDDCNESDRPKKLWSRLTNGEKILLILDDVWGDINFVEIGIPDSDNHKGCSILVTTRNHLVCNRLRCSKTIQLDLLSEEDAWIMFKRHSGLSEISTKNLLDKGRKIANECKRLPIAIAAIASSLNGIQRPEEWEWALKSLKKHTPIPDVDDNLYKIYKCLKFSYDYMKNEKAKKLFLLCSVFQEDEKIPAERLTRLGIGGGLFGDDFVSYEDARTQVVISKNKLLDSCLLLEADQNRVKMHDLVRDAAQWIANKKIQTVKLYDKNQKARVEREANINYLLCEGKLKDVFSFKLDGSKLEILIVIVYKDADCQNVKMEVMNSFFENILGLRVFHLICDHYPRLALSLPHSIQSLKNIRSLLFTLVNLGDISILGNLQSLETLDLDDCKIDELPHGITKLEKLKLLNLNHCGIARNNPFEVIEGCSSLEELYFICSFNAFCREITFPKLQRFYIVNEFRRVNELSSKCVSLGDRDGFFLSETTLKYCMQEAKVLKINRMEGEGRNIIPEMIPMDHGMNDIVELHLRSISQLQCLIDTKHTESKVSKVFSKLVVLNLWNLKNLEELFNGPLSFDSLNSLEKLSISDCEHLKSLFQIIDDGRSCNSMFQKLKVLSIDNCPRIEIILPFLNAHDLPALEYIKIIDCDELKYIFGQDVQLGSLKELELRDIPNFIDIFPECNRTMCLSIKKPSSISGDASEPQEQSKPIKCNIYCCGKKYGHRLRSTTRTKTPLVSKDQPQDNLMKSNSYCLNIWERAQCLSIPSYILCNIKEIKLSYISKMKSVFILSIAPRMLLETLTISKCDELKHIIIDMGDHDNTVGNNWGTVFPNLRNVQVENCEKLEYMIGHDTDDHQNHTEIHLHLPALESFILHNLPSLVSMCPKQYHTKFPKLKSLVVEKCNKLKYVFPISICKELPELMVLIIREADELDEIFASEGDDHKVEIPNLKVVIFENLPSLYHDQGIQFQAVKNRFIQNCQKLSLASASTPDLENVISASDFGYDFELYGYFKTLFRQFQNETKGHNNGNENPETSKDFSDGVEVKASSEHELTSPMKTKQTPKTEHELVENVPDLEIPTNPEELMNEQSMDQQLPLGETDTAVKPSQLEGSTTSEKNVGEMLSTISVTKNESPIQLVSPKQKVSEISVEEGTTIATPKTIASSSGPLCTSKHKTSSQCLKETENQSIQGGPTSKTRNEPSIQLVSDLEGSQETTQTSDNQVFLNDDAVMKVRSNREEQFPKDDDITVTKSKLSPSIESPIASQFPSIPSKDFDLYLHMESVYRQFQAKSKGHENGNENPNAQTTKEFAAWVEAEAASRHALTSSKGMKISFEEGTTSTYDKTITSSNHSEVGDGKICKPSVSIVNRNPPSTKYVNIGDSSEIIAMEDINKLIEEDPLLAFEKLLTEGQIFSIRSLLQKLKTLMDSSSDLDHLVSNQESKLKFISLLRVLNHHQGLLPSNVKEFVENVQNFFNDYIIKHATSQHVLKKHHQLLESKTNLMQKLWRAKSTQAHIDGESSAASAQIHELSLQMDNLEKQRDELKSVVNKCDVQKEKLKDECTEWAHESKELLSALVSTEVDVVEAELVRKLATEGFANFKSSFPTF